VQLTEEAPRNLLGSFDVEMVFANNIKFKEEYVKIRRASVVPITIVCTILAACTPVNSAAGASSGIATIAPMALPTGNVTDASSGAATIAPTAVPTEVIIQASSDQTVSEENLKNGTYIIDGQPITLANGIAEKELAPNSASKQVTRYFGNRVDVDLNSDGLMDSAFFLQQESGGSGTFYYVVAALKTADGYQGANAIFIGDRIAPQSTNVDPYNPSQFIVNYADRNAGEPMSAQLTLGVSKTFKFEDGSLVEVVTSP